MAGTILGADQVAKINDAFPALVAHVRELLSGDQSAVGLMRVHVLVEYLDSDVIFKTFAALPFLSPAEKRALVRAAIFEVLAVNAELLKASPVEAPVKVPVIPQIVEEKVSGVAYTPQTQFKLNVATSQSSGNAGK